MAEYIEREAVLNILASKNAPWDGYQKVSELPIADVMTRDDGIRLGAELAAMHGSDATSQDLEKEYWRGFEDAMQKRDVQPVKHGRWIDGDCRCVTAVCSNCNRLRLGNGAKSAMRLALYCEKCGARMDGET